MTSKPVLLSIKPELHALALKKADERLMNIQEYIYDLIRKDVLAEPQKNSKAGRPKKVDDPYLQYFTRDR